MFLVLGTLAIVTAIGTVILGLKGKNAEVLRFISVSLTALTVCAFYQLDAQYVAREDWSALMDVTPTGGYPVLDWNRSFHFDQQHQFLY